MPKKKSDLELMNEFNLKYSFMNHDEFMRIIHSSPNDSSLENKFRKIFTPINFDGVGFDVAVKFKSMLSDIKTNNPTLKSLVQERIELLQEEIDSSQGLFE